MLTLDKVSDQQRLSNLKAQMTLIKNMKLMEEKKLGIIQEQIQTLGDKFSDLSKTQDLLQNLTRTLIDRELKPIQDFVTFGLKKVFPDKDLEFKIDKSEASTGTRYDFVLRDGDVEDSLDDSFGGSVEEVCSLMLRLVVLRRLGKMPFLAMDEFFTGIDSRHRTNLINLLQTLCEKSGFDILLITHVTDFIHGAHKVLQAYPTLDGLKIKEVISDANGDRYISETEEAKKEVT